MLNDGYFVRLKEMPVNDEVEEDINIQNRVNTHFGFN
jgi:hypothetical protein